MESVLMEWWDWGTGRCQSGLVLPDRWEAGSTPGREKEGPFLPVREAELGPGWEGVLF